MSPGSGLRLLFAFALEGLLAPSAHAQFRLHQGPYFQVEDSTGTEDAPDSFQDRFGDPLEFSQEDWNKARDAAEGRVEQSTGPLDGFTTAFSTAAPTPRAPEVVMPEYGTSLSVTGRKVIGFNFSEKQFVNPQKNVTRPRSQGLFEINQALQIRMQGKVGPKITVNVDYDDTREDKQDISVVYQGDPNEVVQNASFGDIDLSLPATEFVSYNKQLFGIRANLKWQTASAILIASRTKGQTKAKQFIGNTQFQTRDFPDTAYVRRQYYDLTFGDPARLPIQPGSESVFLDVQNPSVASQVGVTSRTVDDLGNAAVAYTGRFQTLGRGQDYTVDYQRGILTLRTPTQQGFVLAVDYAAADGSRIANVNGSGLAKLIKTPNDLAVVVGTTTPSGQLGFKRELKNVYSIGQQQIIRDNGRGNFILRVLDPSRREVGSTLSPPQVYPSTIEVDFEQGLIRLATTFPEAEVYAPTPISRRLLHVEFSFRIKTFFLEPNIVPLSENILVDGQLLSRNVDYFIDYDVGFLTFFNPDRIGAQSRIEVTYDVAPFGGIGTESLLGGRGQWDIGRHLSVGSTLLYQAGSRPPTVPFIDDVPKSLLVMEADSQLKGLRLGRFLNMNFGVEAAQSRQNPNLNGFALLDNMEGVKQEDAASVDRNFWFRASNPAGNAAPADPQSLSWTNIDIKKLDINPNAAAAPGEVQQVLHIDYDFSVNGSTEVSMVYSFSPTGLDFSQKSFLEVVMFRDALTAGTTGPSINFHLGSVAEDSDGDGGVTLTCRNGQQLFGVPETEDRDCDGVLGPSEDVGWTYSPATKNSSTEGEGNGRIDTEDLNQNGRLDSEDLTGCSAGYAGSGVALGGCTSDVFGAGQGSTMAFTGWKTFQIPLNISTATSQNWAAVRQLRISLRRDGASSSTGILRIARMAVVGNNWQKPELFPSTSAASVEVSAVNNVDTIGYQPIFTSGGQAQAVFEDLYGSIEQQRQQTGSKNLQEQSLSITVKGLETGTTAFTTRRFVRALDVSSHDELRFLLFGNAQAPTAQNVAPSAAHIFVLRLGNDTDFFEVRAPLDFPGWKLFTLPMADTNKDGINDVIQDGSGATVVTVSTPTLRQIGVLRAGVANTGGFTASDTVALWFNELHLSEPSLRVGNARMAKADFDVPGWVAFGGKHRFLDRNFQTPVSVITGQDNRQDSAYLNFRRIGFFPMSFNVMRTITDTPDVARTGGQSNLVNLLQQGKVTNWKGNATGTFTWVPLPRLNLQHDRERTDYELLTRLDDRKTYTGTMNFPVPGQRAWLPRTLDLNYAHTLYTVDFKNALPGSFNTAERTNDMGGKLSWQPWGGTTIQPSYSLRLVRESRVDPNVTPLTKLEYPKALSQTAALNTSWQFLTWLKPTANYTMTTIENNNLSSSTFVAGGSSRTFGIGDLKTVNRTANGAINLPLAVGEVFGKLRLLRSMNVVSSYQLQDGDIWQNVEKGLDTKPLLWLRKPLSPRESVAQNTSRTLRDTYSSTVRWSPLEAYELPGRWSPLRTLGLTNNYTYSVQRSVVTGTPSRTINKTLPDLVATIGQLEKALRTEAYMSNTQLNAKFSKQRSETENVNLNLNRNVGFDLRSLVFTKFDTALAVNFREGETEDLRTKLVTQETEHKDAALQTTFNAGAWRLTPKVDYTVDRTQQGPTTTQDVKVVTPSLLARADINLPAGLKLPLLKNPLMFTNRIIWTTNASLAMRRSEIRQADNSNLLNLSTNADYEIAQNLRMTLNGTIQRLWHRFLPEEDFLSYQLGTTLTFQF